MPEKFMDTITPPYFIIGPAENGKSTVRRKLCAATGLEGGSCSDVIYTMWSVVTSISEEKLRAMPKSEARPILVALGDWLTGGKPDADGYRNPVSSFRENFPHDLVDGDPSVLCNSKLPLPNPSFLIHFLWTNGVRVIDGIRREDELACSYPPLEWAGARPVIVRVTDPRKDAVEGDNYCIRDIWVDFEVVNDSEIDDLDKKVREIVEFYAFMRLE